MSQSFGTTSWSTVMAAKGTGDPASQAALNDLCATYWPPLYAYLRQKGLPKEVAQDLVQEFFCQLLSRRFLRKVDQSEGKFRSFLMACFRNFLRDDLKNRQAQKRSVEQVPISDLDYAAVERQYALDHDARADPRIMFDRQWAQTLLETVLARLEDEFALAGRQHAFACLKDSLIDSNVMPSYRTLGERLEMTDGAVKVAIHRMRKRYGVLLREEVARTVESPEQIEEELRYLVEVSGL